MERNKGGDNVGKGCYWDIRNGMRVDVVGRGVSYIRLSPHLVTMAALVAAPLMVISVLFLIVVAIIGFAAKNVFVALRQLLTTHWTQNSTSPETSFAHQGVDGLNGVPAIAPLADLISIEGSTRV